jgi:hypothetical protein
MSNFFGHLNPISRPTTLERMWATQRTQKRERTKGTLTPATPRSFDIVQRANDRVMKSMWEEINEGRKEFRQYQQVGEKLE